MKKHATTLLLAIGALAAMGAIGFSYEHCIGPNQPVWHPQAKHWSDMPLRVHWDRKAWAGLSESIEEAVGAWNSSTGAKLLVKVDDIYQANVRIVSADGEACSQPIEFGDDDAHAYLCPDGTAEIHIAAPGTVNCMARITMHELGHVLGLAHTPVGIMRSEVDCDALMISSDAQEAALRARYGR